MAEHRPEVVLVRHGETEWSVSGQHTGRTDIPLTENGKRMAALVGNALRGHTFALVLVSPLKRAMETCRLAGLGEQAQVRPDLMEWDYGTYEGLTTPQIRQERPGWVLWDDGAPGGEGVFDVGRRVDRVITEVRAAGGDVAIFAHGHVLRVLAARWIGLPPGAGRLFSLSTGTISTLGYEREQSTFLRWNNNAHLGIPTL